MDSALLAPLSVLAFLTITPGADTLLTLRNALAHGRRAAFLGALGIAAGTVLHAAFSAIGLSALLATSSRAFTFLKWIGAGYLVFLGLQTLWQARGRHALVRTALSEGSPPFRGAVSGMRAFAQGFLTNVTNPKVALFYLTFLPQFMAPGDPVLAKSLLLGLAHAAMGLTWLGGIALLAHRAGKSPAGLRVRGWVTRASGAVLVALGVRLATARAGEA